MSWLSGKGVGKIHLKSSCHVAVTERGGVAVRRTQTQTKGGLKQKIQNAEGKKCRHGREPGTHGNHMERY